MRNFSKFFSENKGQLSPQQFAEEFGNVQKQYFAAKQKDTFCLEADIFAHELVEDSDIDFAGIVMSTLCKLTQYIPEKLEGYAKKGLKIAELNNDPIHMMARLNDLRKIYYRRYNKLYEYLQVLYKQEMCLKQILENYDDAIGSFHTVQKKPAPKKDYQLMLAHVQTEIAKITKRKHPYSAQERLIDARQTFENRCYHKNVDYIDMLLNEIYQSLKH